MFSLVFSSFGSCVLRLVAVQVPRASPKRWERWGISTTAPLLDPQKLLKKRDIREDDSREWTSNIFSDYFHLGSMVSRDDCFKQNTCRAKSIKSKDSVWKKRMKSPALAALYKRLGRSPSAHGEVDEVRPAASAFQWRVAWPPRVRDCKGATLEEGSAIVIWFAQLTIVTAFTTCKKLWFVFECIFS